MKMHVVVKRLGDKPWRAAGEPMFADRRLAENFIECAQATDTEPRYKFGIVSGEIEEVSVRP